MAVSKQYAEPKSYEGKLARVMERFGVAEKDYDYNFDRHGAWVGFFYRGQYYRFDHSVENAAKHGIKVNYGSDIFAQIVLSLEDLARMIERGIYDLQVWVAGLKALPPARAAVLPWWAATLELKGLPATADEVNAQYRELAKLRHPDGGGTNNEMAELNRARDEALLALEGKA
jgi:hypothetical protein